jgi:hypothetical protein
MTPLFTLPSATTTLSGIADYSGNTFLAFLPLVYLLAGVVIGALVVSALVAAFIGGAKKITGGGRGGRRRGRR